MPIIIIDIVDGIDYGEDVGQDLYAPLLPKKKKASSPKKEEKVETPRLELPLLEHDWAK